MISEDYMCMLYLNYKETEKETNYLYSLMITI